MLDKSAPQSQVCASGPLAGFRIVEFAGIGPGPFACMLLADMGAEVITLDRVGAKKNLKAVAVRGRKVVELDLKNRSAIAQVLDLLSHADALIEGFRPGVMERLGLGPDVVLAGNPKLVYGRMTGWGQDRCRRIRQCGSRPEGRRRELAIAGLIYRARCCSIVGEKVMPPGSCCRGGRDR